MKALRTSLLVLIAALVVMVAAAPAWAQTHGGTGILKIKPGSRATGMGQGGVALYQRAHSVWWNPAMLAQARGKEFSSTIVKLVPDLADDVYYLNLGYASHLEGWGGIGIDLMYLSYGETEAVSSEGESFGFFSSYELVPVVGFGTRLIGGAEDEWGTGGPLGSFDVGVSLKYVWVDLAPDWAMGIVGESKDGRADAFAVDLGCLMRGVVGPFPYALGLNIQNLGSKLVYIDADQGDPLPRNLKAGFALSAYESPGFSVVGVFDFNKSLISYDTDDPYAVDSYFGWGDQKELLNMGAEFVLRDRLSGRLGYVHDPEGEIEAMTFGLGLDLPISGGSKLLRFDYSSVPQALDLDRVSYLSVGVLFQ